ncbi:MAG TPA: T9SS type A sorting domain-containing protein [Arachidicoccus soli]|nr:T9SS type A sorting domain-containing protein [Arachidicoccus soli]
MRYRFTWLTFVFLLSGNLYATEYYVSEATGSNSNNGLSTTTPLKLINAAITKAVPGDIINVMAGTYREQVNVRKDGITIRPYNGDAVIINGCNIVSGWTKVGATDTYKASAPINLTDKWGSNQVFSDGKMIELARWPDQTSTNIVMPTNAKADNIVKSGNNIIITDYDFEGQGNLWLGAKIWINLSRNIYDGQGWSGTVVAVTDYEITVNFTTPFPPVIGDAPWGLGEGTEYFLFNPTPAGVASFGGINNVLSPGEWWKDGSDLYVKTPNSAAPSETSTGTNVIEHKNRYFGFQSTTGSGDYTISGFTLFGCTIATDPGALNNRGILETAKNIVLDNLTFLYPSHTTDFTLGYQDGHYTWSGVSISGRNITLKNSTIKYTSASGVSIQGAGIKLLNNVIESTNFLCSNAGAVNTGFVCLDAEIANNTISNTTIMAINFKYSQNSDLNKKGLYRIHHNTIFDFMRRSSDSGAIDMVGSDLRWIRIDHNVIYNNFPPDPNHAIAGIYLDYGGGSGSFRPIRAIVDHNMISNIKEGILVNPGNYVDIFYNTIIGGIPNDIKSIGLNSNSGDFNDIRVYNNILSGPIKRFSFVGGNLPPTDFRNNIVNATGTVLNDLFVNADGRDYTLKPTAVAAIDKGISTGAYDVDVVGIPDLGAKEWGSNTAPDTEAPAVITNVAASAITSSGFSLSYSTTDNLGVSSYDIFLNGVLAKNSPNTTEVFTGLNSTTTYNVEIVAIDATGNRSPKSVVLPVKTLLPPGVVNNGDVTPPSVPVNLRGSGATPNGGTVTWDIATDNTAVTGYEVFLNGNYFQTVSTNTIVLSSLLPNTSTDVQVRAKDEMGNVSGLSTVLPLITRSLNNNDTKYEAENASLTGGTFRQNNTPSYSGTGFADGFKVVGGSAKFSGVQTPAAGVTDILIRYSQSEAPFRYFDVYVNNVFQKTVEFPFTVNRENWTFLSVPLNLNAGSNDIEFRVGPDNNCRILLDYISTNFNPLVLPVSLVKYTATLGSNNTAKLNWRTSSENNNAYFKVERSSDGINYKEIGRVNSKGSAGGDYVFTDFEPLYGTGYYQLSQYDLDGSRKDLGVQAVSTRIDKKEINFYPNPVTDGYLNINLNSYSTTQGLTIKITDLNGRIVYVKQLVGNESNLLTINIGQLSSGIYGMTITGPNLNYASKVIVN